MTERIKPFYEVPYDLEDTVLLEAPSAVLSQNGKEYAGRFQIIHSWRSTYSTMIFRSQDLNADDLEFASAMVTPEGLPPIRMDVMTGSGQTVSGTIGDYADVGTDYKIDEVTFHLANVANLNTEGKEDYVENDWGRRRYLAGPQIVLQ